LPMERSLGDDTEVEVAHVERAGEISTRFLDNIETVVYGKRQKLALVLTALICDGHVLLEDVPGTAKTMLARAIAGSIAGATTSRIQCTPDLQPTDVTGLSVFDQRSRAVVIKGGDAENTGENGRLIHPGTFAYGG
ncbi:MAG: AAA family ATPase, partial [Chitinophagaceae bacterium]|nr:AAA family ATPase [Chitinophagaceae bacterium]